MGMTPCKSAPLTEEQRQLVTDNMPLAFHWARRWVRHPNDHDDVVQSAMLGLMHAATKFDPTKGFKFSTYARFWVYQHMQRWRETGGCGVIRTPAHSSVDDPRVARARAVPLSLSHADGFFDGSGLAVDPCDVVEDVELATEHDKVADAMRYLSPRERRIIDMRFFESKTMSQIGRVLGITRERVRQLELRAIVRLRKALGHMSFMSKKYGAKKKVAV